MVGLHLFDSKLAPTDPRSNMLQILLERKKYEEAMSEHSLNSCLDVTSHKMIFGCGMLFCVSVSFERVFLADRFDFTKRQY